MWQLIVESIVALLLIAGGLTALTGALGMLRFNDFYMRMHGPAMSSTIGIGSIILASIGFLWFHTGVFSAQELLLMVLLMVTTPISAHLLTMSAMHMKLPRQSNTLGGPFEINEQIDQD